MTPTAVVPDPDPDPDPLYERIRSEALSALADEPSLGPYLEATVLSPDLSTFGGTVARVVGLRLSAAVAVSAAPPEAQSRSPPALGAAFFEGAVLSGLASKGDGLDAGHPMARSIRLDALAVLERDPAARTLLEVVCFGKGYAALVCHRAARRKWAGAAAAAAGGGGGGGGEGGRIFALLLQSASSAAFGVDIHPGASIGAGVMIDHATGVVVGETAAVGDGTTLLHGVTLGGTGKDGASDRHPKVGRDCLIGAGCQILGNIRVGDGAKLGAGSVVLRPIPSGATAVGAPARIIGFASEEKPGAAGDVALAQVDRLAPSEASDGDDDDDGNGTSATEPTTSTEEENGGAIDYESGVKEGGGFGPATIDGRGGGMAESDFFSGSLSLDAPKAEASASSSVASLRRGTRAGAGAGRNFCPFRSFSRTSGRAGVPPGMVDLSNLRSLLAGEEGATECQTGEVYFALLRLSPPWARRVGCIPPRVFRENFSRVAAEHTSIDSDRLEACAAGDEGALGLGRKASARFGDMFASLRLSCCEED